MCVLSKLTLSAAPLCGAAVSRLLHSSGRLVNKTDFMLIGESLERHQIAVHTLIRTFTLYWTSRLTGTASLLEPSCTTSQMCLTLSPSVTEFVWTQWQITHICASLSFFCCCLVFLSTIYKDCTYCIVYFYLCKVFFMLQLRSFPIWEQ